MKVKYYELDSEEQALLAAYEQGEFKAVKDLSKQIKRLKDAAVLTGKKTRNINIRISEKDLLKLKTRASEEGIPYQTLAGSIIHKYTAI